MSNVADKEYQELYLGASNLLIQEFGLPKDCQLPYKYQRIYQKSLAAYMTEMDLEKAVELMEDFLAYFGNEFETIPESCLKYAIHLDCNVNEAEKMVGELEQFNQQLQASQQNKEALSQSDQSPPNTLDPNPPTTQPS